MTKVKFQILMDGWTPDDHRFLTGKTRGWVSGDGRWFCFDELHELLLFTYYLDGDAW